MFGYRKIPIPILSPSLIVFSLTAHPDMVHTLVSLFKICVTVHLSFHILRNKELKEGAQNLFYACLQEWQTAFMKH